MARPTKDKEIDLLKAVKLRMDKGLSFKEIGKVMGVAPQTIQIRLKRLGSAFNDPAQVEVLKAHEPVMIDSVRALILERMGTVLGDSKTNISFSQLALGYGIMLDKARLIRGETTGGIQQITALILAAHKQGKSEGDKASAIDVTPETKGKGHRVKAIASTHTPIDGAEGDTDTP